MKNLTHATLLCALAVISPVFAHGDQEPISLGCDSRNAVAYASFKGALAGLGAYAGFQLITNNFKWHAITDHPYKALAALFIGGAINGFWAEQYTPEKHFEFARAELLRISQNELFVLLVSTEPDKLISTLKDRYFREKLPLYTAFKQLDKICSVVDQSKESLNQVLASTRQDLYQEANELQMIADMYLVILKDIFKQLKSDSNFIAECNAGTLELMKEAQEAAAHAAEASAFTQQMAYMSGHSHCDHTLATNVTIVPSVSVAAMPNVSA